MTVNASDREWFDRTGYLVCPDVVDRATLDDLGRRLDDLLAGDLPLPAGHLIDQFGRGGRLQLRKVRSLNAIDDTFRDLARLPPIANRVADLLDDEPLLFRDVTIVKPAYNGVPFHWHQDSAYWDVSPPAPVSVWVRWPMSGQTPARSKSSPAATASLSSTTCT